MFRWMTMGGMVEGVENGQWHPHPAFPSRLGEHHKQVSFPSSARDKALYNVSQK